MRQQGCVNGTIHDFLDGQLADPDPCKYISFQKVWPTAQGEDTTDP